MLKNAFAPTTFWQYLIFQSNFRRNVLILNSLNDQQIVIYGDDFNVCLLYPNMHFFFFLCINMQLLEFQNCY